MIASHRFGAGLALLLLLGSLGCNPKIGDECDLDTDCSSSGDRLCDATQPGGYCTKFNCEPGTCPDEATCIGFRTTESMLVTEDGTAYRCADPQHTSRFQRTFCMLRCKSKSDCRSGYDCLDMREPANPFGAVVVEHGGSGKVCAVPYSGPPLTYLNEAGDPDSGVPGICGGAVEGTGGVAGTGGVGPVAGAAGSGAQSGGGVSGAPTSGGAAGSGARPAAGTSGASGE